MGTRRARTASALTALTLAVLTTPTAASSAPAAPLPAVDVDAHRTVRTADGRTLQVPVDLGGKGELPRLVDSSAAPPAKASTTSGAYAPRPAHLLRDAAWTFYSTPRALTTPRATYVGSVTRRGDIQVTRVSGADARVDHRTLGRAEADDHVAPSLLRTTNGRIAAFWAGHNSRPVRYRVTSTAESVTTFGSTRSLAGSGLEQMDATYTQVVQLPGERQRYWLITRGADKHWYLTTSADLRRWTRAVRIITNPYRKYDAWPYLKVVPSAYRTLDIAVTDGAPNQPAARNSLYHLRYSSGVFRRADGSRVASLWQVRQGRAIDPREGTLLYNGSSPEGPARVYDIARGPSGALAVGMTTEAVVDGRRSYSYKWFRLGYRRWHASTLTRGPGSFPAGYDLTYGQPGRALLVSSVSPTGRVQEWVTRDEGRSWLHRDVTPDAKGYRTPVVPWGVAPPEQGPAGGDITGLWLAGTRSGWRDGAWDLGARMETAGPAPVTVSRGVSVVQKGVWSVAGYVRQGVGGPGASSARVLVQVRHPGASSFTTVKEVESASDGRYAAWVRTSSGARVRVTVLPGNRWGRAVVADATLR